MNSSIRFAEIFEGDSAQDLIIFIIKKKNKQLLSVSKKPISWIYTWENSFEIYDKKN